MVAADLMPRILKVLIGAVVAVLAVTAGAVVLVAVAALFLGFLLARGIRRRVARTTARPTMRPRPERGDVIDVVATEIPTPKD